MYIVKDITNIYSPVTLAITEELPDAIRAIKGKIYWLEEDQKNPDHFDIITWQCGQFIIEPYKEKNNA